MPALLRQSVPLASIPPDFVDHFVFANPAGTRSVVHFRFDQLVVLDDGYTRIAICAPIVGSAGINRVVIHAGADNGVGIWDPGFVNWGPEDRLTMVGTSADDSIWGGLVDSTMYGGAGDDRLFAPFSATTVMYGGSGKDVMGTAGSGVATFFGGDGDDDFNSSSSGVATLFGGNGNDGMSAYGGARRCGAAMVMIG